MRRWPLPQPLPRREGRNMWGYPYWAANTVLGYFFSHRTHRFNRTCGALFRTHRTPPAYRVHRGLSAIIITNKGHNEAYILFIGVSRWLLPFPSGEGPGEGPLSFWPLCVLFFCVLCEKKNICETRWGGFSLTELTEFTEHFCAQFRAHRTPSAYRVHRALLPKMAVTFCEIGWLNVSVGCCVFCSSVFSVRKRTFAKLAGEVFLSQNSQILQNLFAHCFELTEGLRHTDITERYS